MNIEFVVGVCVGGLVIGGFMAFLIATRKPRAIDKVRRAIDTLGALCDLPQRQYQQTIYPADFANDAYITAALEAARKVRSKAKGNVPWRDEELAAQIVILESFFKLGVGDAVAWLREADGDFERLPYILRRHLREQEERKNSVAQVLGTRQS